MDLITGEYKGTLTVRDDRSFTLNGIFLGSEPPKPTPTPTPTPAPTQPPAGNIQEVPLGAQNWLDKAIPGVKYYSLLPFPFSQDISIQVGQGRGGPSPTHVRMSISDQPGGGIGSPAPWGAEGDPNAGVTISASLNPQVDRAGNPLYQAKVTSDKQWYFCFEVNSAPSGDPGGVVYYPY